MKRDNDRNKCAATRPGGIDPSYTKQCARRATHGEWCRQHAESLGGWRLAPPHAPIAWDDVMLDALTESDNGNNPFYADDADTLALARELADAVRGALR